MPGQATLLALLLSAGLAVSMPSDGSPVPTAVRHPEGLVHGYLELSTLQGRRLASGDLLQDSRGDEVTSRLVFRFEDGSSHDETAVFRQRGHFQLLRYRLVQKGTAFPRALDLTLNAEHGQVAVDYTDEDGKRKHENESRPLPADLANGIVPILLKNRGEGQPTLSFLAATPSPELVRLEVEAAGEESFRIAGAVRRSIHYVVKVDIGGLKGVLAALLGKQPPDTHVWIQAGEFPGFLKSEGPLYVGGPAWRIELTSPGWPPSEG